jgi:hypothetical protein
MIDPGRDTAAKEDDPRKEASKQTKNKVLHDGFQGDF